MDSGTSALLTDLYQLNMIQAYLDHGEASTAVFELFVRRLPERRNFLVAGGLESALDFLEGLRFTSGEVAWLQSTGRFDSRMLDYLAALRFTGDVHAMPEGRVFFADEPILRITAPLPEAQLVETRMLNGLHFQSLIASKAARMVLAAPGKTLVDWKAVLRCSGRRASSCSTRSRISERSAATSGEGPPVCGSCSERGSALLTASAWIPLRATFH